MPSVLLAAWEPSEAHHGLAFMALGLCFQSDTSPGYCWPFQGSQREVLIRLPMQIQPTTVTIQHTSKAASPLGTVSSAPRDFTVSVSLCRALGAGTGPRGKAVRGTWSSLRLCRDWCAPKHCCSLRGHYKGHAGGVSPLLRLAQRVLAQHPQAFEQQPRGTLSPTASCTRLCWS